LFTFSLFFSSVRLSLGILFCFIPGNLVAWFLLRRRRLGAASLVYLTNTYLIYVFQTVLNGGIESKALIVWSSLPVLSALLVSRRVSWVFAWVSFATLSFFAFLGWWGHPLEKWMPGIPTGLWVTNGFLIWFLFPMRLVLRQGLGESSGPGAGDLEGASSDRGREGRPPGKGLPDAQDGFPGTDRGRHGPGFGGFTAGRRRQVEGDREASSERRGVARLLGTARGDVGECARAESEPSRVLKTG
jgi:hypothetical protein